MNEHLTPEQLERFGKATASPADLVRMDRHLASCAQCRSQIPFDRHRLESLSILADKDIPEDHLSYEFMEAFVQSQVEDVDREIVTSHMEFCSECAERIQGLQAFAAVLDSPVAQKTAAVAASQEPLSLWARMSSLFNAPRWSYGVVAAASSILVFGVMFQQSALRFLPTGNASLVLWRPAEYRSILDSVANAPVSEVPELLKKVASLSMPNPHALRPSQVVVRSQRPTFHWEPIGDADAYEIDIRSESAPIAKILVPGAEWTPEADLQRGIVYSWKVVPYKGGQPLQGVTGLAWLARFGVVSDTDEKMIEEVLNQAPDSHLLIAATYLRAGLIDEAEAALDRALDPAKNSGNEAEKLRARINAIRESIK